jgi:carnitine O-acetyltransferase
VRGLQPVVEYGNRRHVSATPSSRTFGNEAQLPRVPLPTLEESCERFLDWCAPLLRGDELAATKDAVASFLHRRSPAHELQAALERYDQDGRTQSWLDAFWSDRYLGRRDRIALNANFFLLLKVSDQGQIERAAGLIAAAVNYKLRLDRERIPPVVRNGHALSMEQQRFLFSTTRIPGRERDTVRSPYSASWPGPSQERHVAVLNRGRIFRMDVIGPGGRPHSLDDLADGLQSVTGERAPGRGRPSVCHLTAKPRAEWAESRRALLDCHPGNAKALDAIETALFCLCLDQTAPKNALEACDELLHGDSGNRWFDKALSLIVFEDGTAGLNVEHSKLDGSTVVDLVDSLLEQTPDEHTRQSGAKRQGMPLIEAVAFDLNAELQRDAGLAAAAFAAQAADTATHVLEIEDIGSDRVKELGMSPDAFVQMAFQLAHKRTRGAVGATYESIATREYRNGRTEAMRVVTPEVLRFVTAMDEADAPTRRKAFRVAAEKHVERVRQCRAGAAPEQHLWELQLLQRRHGEATAIAKPPALYETPGWLAMRNDYLSTSTTPSANIRYGGFGPTSERCIGLGYTLLRDRFRLHLSTRRSSADELPRFVEKLREALRELEGLLAPSARSAEPPKATALAHDAWLRLPQ